MQSGIDGNSLFCFVGLFSALLVLEIKNIILRSLSLSLSLCMLPPKTEKESALHSGKDKVHIRLLKPTNEMKSLPGDHTT